MMTAEEAGVQYATVTQSILSQSFHEDAVAHTKAGALVMFSGVVRNHDGGRPVSSLFYEAHPEADQVMARIAAEISGRHPGTRIAVSHRVGTLHVGDLALVAVVASAHRGEGFAACATLVDEIKVQLPIWKRQVFTDGNEEWVGST